jgi:hypothetical protein
VNIVNGASPAVTHNWIVGNAIDIVANGAATTNISFNTYDIFQINAAVGSFNLNSQGQIVPPNSAGVAAPLAP